MNPSAAFNLLELLQAVICIFIICGTDESATEFHRASLDFCPRYSVGCLNILISLRDNMFVMPEFAVLSVPVVLKMHQEVQRFLQQYVQQRSLQLLAAARVTGPFKKRAAKSSAGGNQLPTCPVFLRYHIICFWQKLNLINFFSFAYQANQSLHAL